MPENQPKVHHLPIGSLFSTKSYPLGYLRLMLGIGALSGLGFWLLLVHFYPYYQFPAFAFFFPSGLMVAGLGATYLYQKARVRLPDLIFYIATACYFCLVYVSFLNRLSYEFLVSLTSAQVLFSVSFRHLKSFLAFAGTSLLFLGACIWMVVDLLPPAILVWIIFFGATLLSGLYVGIKAWRIEHQVRFGETLNQLLDSTNQAILLFDAGLSELIYSNEAGWQLWESLRVNYPGATVEGVFLRLGFGPGAIRTLSVTDLSEKTQPHQAIIARNGHTHTYSLTFKRLQLHTLEAFMVSLEDISLRRSQEDALAYSHYLNETLIQSIPDVLLTLNRDADIVGVHMSHVWQEQASNSFIAGENLLTWATNHMPLQEMLLLTESIEKARSEAPQSFTSWIGAIDTGKLFLEFRISKLGAGPDLLVVVRNHTRPKELEVSRMQSELKYLRLFDSATDGILVINRETLHLEDANPAACDLLEINRDKLNGHVLTEFVSGHSEENLLQMIGEGQGDSLQFQELMLNTLSGSQLTVELLAKPLPPLESAVTMLVIRDLRERKVQQMLVQRYADLFYNLDKSIVILHLEESNDPASLRVVSLNQMACEQLELEQAESVGMLLDDIKPEWSLFNGPVHIQRAIVEQTIEQLWSVPNPGPDMQINFWNVKIVPLPGNMAGVFMDSVTLQKLADDKLRAQAHLVEHVSDAIISVTTGFIIQSWNPAAENIYGWKAREVIGKPLNELLGTEFIGTSAQAALNDLFAKGSWTGEGIHSSKQGKKVYVSASAKVVYDAKLKPKQVVILNRDISQRRLWEEQIKQSERKFRDLFSFSPEAILVVSPDKHVLDANPIALKILKCTRTKMVGISLHQLIPAASQELFNTSLAEVLELRSSFFDMPFMAMDGTLFTAELRARAFERNGENAIILHISDISERISAEGKLLLFQSLVNHSTDVIFIVNYKTGRVVYSNDQTWKQLGYRAIELPNLHLFDLCLTLDHHPIPIRKLQELRDHRSDIFSGRLIRKDRSSYTVEINMGYLSMTNQEYLICIARDITERNYQEEMLRQNELKYRTLVENMNEGLILTDVEETILFVNDSLCRILGMTREELMGKRTFHLFSADQRELILSKNALRLEGIADKYEMQFIRGDGKSVWLEIAGSPFKDTFSDVTGTIAIVNDISDRKLSEQLLLEKNNELDAFAYKASHDLRGPLTTIQGITTLARLQKDKEDPEVFYHLIDRTSGRLSTILEELEEVARIRKSEAHTTQIDLEQEIKEIFDQLKLDNRCEGIELKQELRIKSPLEIDSRLLRSAISNVVLNSIVYQRKAEPNPYVKITASKSGKDLVLTVEDNGQGIDPKIRQRVFEMFFRGNHQSKGSGLGLYIVKNAVEKLGGSIRLDSEEGIGTTVYFRIPLQQTREVIRILA